MAINSNNPFDINTANALQANHKYFELADYLSKYNNGNKYERQIGYQQIVALRQQGRMYNALYNKANNEQRQAIDFLQTISDNGTFARDKSGIINPFGNQYVNILNNLGSNNKQKATTVSVKFEPKVVKKYVDLPIFGKVDWLAKDEKYDNNAYDLFLKQNHLTDKQLKSMDGVKVSTANGVTTVDIKKTSKDAFRLLTGLKDVDSNHNTNGVIDQNVTNADKRYYIAGKDSAGNLIKPSGSVGIGHVMDMAVTYDKTKNSDLDDNFKGYLKGGQNNQLNQLLNQAKALQDQVTGGDKQHFSSSLMVSSASSAAEEQVYAALSKGMITPAQAGDYLTMIKRDLDNQVLGAGVGENDIYVSGYEGDDGENNKSREYEKVSDPKQRDYYNNLIKHAVLDGTISYHMAASGDKFGTQIVITPKNPTKEDNTDSNTVKDAEGEGPEVARSISIFIPDWNGQDAEQSLRRNTKTRAALEANNMETYDYDMDIPQEGTLRHTELGFSLVGNDKEEQPISKEDAQRLLNKRFIIEDVTEEAKNSFYDPSTGNSLVTDSQGNINQANYKRAYDNANKIIDIRTMQAMQDIYPETVSRIQEYTQNGVDASGLQEAYNNERESIAAYIKNMINQ